MARLSRKVDWALVWTSIRTHSSVLKIVNVDGDWEGRSEGDVRKMHEKGKDPQVWRKEMTWNPEDSTPSLIVQHHLKNRLFDDFTNIFGTTHPNMAIDSMRGGILPQGCVSHSESIAKLG